MANKKNIFVMVKIPMTKKEVKIIVGVPCKEHQKGCPACDAWEQWKKNGMVSMPFEKEELMGLLK
jgi:hypothetical protein